MRLFCTLFRLILAAKRWNTSTDEVCGAATPVLLGLRSASRADFHLSIPISIILLAERLGPFVACFIGASRCANECDIVLLTIMENNHMKKIQSRVQRQGQIYRFSLADIDYVAFVWQAGVGFRGRIQGNPRVPEQTGSSSLAVREALMQWLSAENASL